jgi:hypothetical protein
MIATSTKHTHTNTHTTALYTVLTPKDAANLWVVEVLEVVLEGVTDAKLTALERE